MTIICTFLVICMPARNAATTIQSTIESFLSQQQSSHRFKLLIGYQESTDDTRKIIDTYLSETNIQLIELSSSGISQARNDLLSEAQRRFPTCDLIGRLDADDVIYKQDTLLKISHYFRQSPCDVLIAGNLQSRNGETLPVANLPEQDLRNPAVLEERLYSMASGDLSAELPSCNVFVSPNVRITYPSVPSAEDHWYLVELLLRCDSLRIGIADSLIYCIYSLDGAATADNKRQDSYLSTRRRLLNYYRSKTR